MFFSKVLTNWRKLQKELLFFSAEQSGVGLFAAVFTTKEGGNFTLHVFCLQQNLAFICFFFQQDAHGLVFTRKVWSGLQISSRRYKVSSAFTAWSISTVVELFSC